MGQFQPIKKITDFFSKKETATATEKELSPLQYLNKINDMLVKTDIGQDIDPEILIKHFSFSRKVSKLAKPLLRFQNLFPPPLRISLEMLASQSMTPDVMTAMGPGISLYRNYIENALKTPEQGGKPIVWLIWCLCSDLIIAFDAQPFCTEGLAVIPLVLGQEPTESLIDIAEQSGVPPEFCSSSKSALGSTIANQLPNPACVVASNHPCDSMVSSYQLIEYMTGAPVYRLDTPNWDDERSLNYYVEDVKQLISFMETHLGKKLDYDRLKEVITESNKTNELLIEINEMQRAKPCPASGMPNMMAWFFRLLGMGSPEVTEVTRRLHKIVKNNYLSGKSAIKKEKIRVIWYDVPITFYPLIIWMEETFGAVIVVDLLCYINSPIIDTSSPESMIRGIAAENMNLTMTRQFHGQAELVQRDLYRVCEEYQGDCFIYTGHTGCKHGWALTRHLKEYMKKIGMPLLILTSDIFDQRVTNMGQLKKQIEDFFVTNGLV